MIRLENVDACMRKDVLNREMKKLTDGDYNIVTQFTKWGHLNIDCYLLADKQNMKKDKYFYRLRLFSCNGVKYI